MTRKEAAELVRGIASEYYDFAHRDAFSGFSEDDWDRYIALREASDLLESVEPNKKVKDRMGCYQ